MSAFRRRLFKRSLFYFPESRFTVRGENLGDRPTLLLFDLRIEILKRH
jgi:hypothetical protein